MNQTGRALMLLALLAAAGCAKKPPPPPEQPPAPPPPLTAADGTYVGTSTRYQADSRTCPSPGRVTIRVLDGMFSYRWSSRLSIAATISPDLSAHGEEGDITLTGKVDGNRLTGDVSNANCAYHFTTTKRPPPPPLR